SRLARADPAWKSNRAEDGLVSDGERALRWLLQSLVPPVGSIEVVLRDVFPNFEQINSGLWRIDVISHFARRVVGCSVPGFRHAPVRQESFRPVSIAPSPRQSRRPASGAGPHDFRVV